MLEVRGSHGQRRMKMARSFASLLVGQCSSRSPPARRRCPCPRRQ